MFGNTQETERRSGAPHHEIPFVPQWKIEVIWEFAMDDGEENCIVVRGFAFGIAAIAEDEAEGVGRLMPCSSSLRWIRFLGVVLGEAGQFKGISQIGGCEAIAEKFCKGAAVYGSVCGMGEVVMDVGFTRRWEKGKPVLFNAGAGGGWIAGEFSECWVGFKGPERRVAW